MKRVRERTRRSFLQGGALAAGVLSARSWSALARGESPNDRIRVGVIGTGVRGKYLIGNLPETAQVASICDCATSRIAGVMAPKGTFAGVLAGFVDRDATDCTTHQDYRRLLDVEKLDAVIIATPDHHHVPAAMLALQARLDIYLEKPLTVSIREGRILADAVRKTGRVVQVGSQQRTMEMNRFACEFICDGGLGKVHHIDFPNYPGPIADPDYPAEPVTDGLDWDLFLGPTPRRPHNRKLWVKDDFKVGNLLWRGWDLFRDYSGHIMTNWGAHHIDMVQYALGMDESGPSRVSPLNPASGALERDWNGTWHEKTPRPDAPWNSESRLRPVTLEYANGITLTLKPGVSHTTFHGQRGRMVVSRNRFSTDPPDLVKDGPDPQVARKWQGSGHVARPHLQNWLDCIRSRGVTHAPVEVGHRTVTVCHLVNLARELNRTLRWDPSAESFVDDAEANRLLDRPRRPGFELPVV